MSTHAPGKTVTIQGLRQKKELGEKIVSLTCYDYTTARLLDETPLDFLLVGDSLAMTQLGHANTLSVTMDEMLHHIKAVTRGAQQKLVVADMPFLSYQVSHEEAVRNAGRFLQEGHADAVKLEGASPRILSIIEHLVEIGIPVMGHLGLTPQSVQTLGGYRLQAKTLETAQKLLEDARQLQASGAFAVVLEMVPVEVAALISRELAIPTIGIGAGNACDGQVLVIDDFLGRFPDFMPKFVRAYGRFGVALQEAALRYSQETRTGEFPNNLVEAYPFPPEHLTALEKMGSRTVGISAQNPMTTRV